MHSTTSPVIPYFELSGSPYEQGLAHGRLAHAEINHNLEVYFWRFERESKISRTEVLRRAGLYLKNIEKSAPLYAEGMKGIADGAKRELLEIVALNARFELIYSEASTQGKLPETDGCTTFAVLPEKTTTGHLMLGENWDWITNVKALVLKIMEPNKPDLLCFTEAGVFGGKIGLNALGLGLVINGLNSNKDDWSKIQKPFHVRCWEILRSRTFEEAVNVVTSVPRACSANFVIAQVDRRVINIEAAPTKHLALEPQNGYVAHTNHFLEPERLDILVPEVSKRPSTRLRYARVTKLLSEAGKLDLSGVQKILTDHDDYPYSLCRHPDEAFPPEEHYQSVVSVMMDLHQKKLHIAPGPPCQHQYQTLTLN
jgi:isopenicillin-N N-acyltransferase-like protein